MFISKSSDSSGKTLEEVIHIISLSKSNTLIIILINSSYQILYYRSYICHEDIFRNKPHKEQSFCENILVIISNVASIRSFLLILYSIVRVLARLFQSKERKKRKYSESNIFFSFNYRKSGLRMRKLQQVPTVTRCYLTS